MGGKEVTKLDALEKEENLESMHGVLFGGKLTAEPRPFPGGPSKSLGSRITNQICAKPSRYPSSIEERRISSTGEA